MDWTHSSSNLSTITTTLTSINSSKTTITTTWWISTKWTNSRDQRETSRCSNSPTTIGMLSHRNSSRSKETFGLRAVACSTCQIWKLEINLAWSSTHSNKRKTRTETSCLQVTTLTSYGLRQMPEEITSSGSVEAWRLLRTREGSCPWLTLTNLSLSLSSIPCNIPIRWWTISSHHMAAISSVECQLPLSSRCLKTMPTLDLQGVSISSNHNPAIAATPSAVSTWAVH